MIQQNNIIMIVGYFLNDKNLTLKKLTTFYYYMILRCKELLRFSVNEFIKVY